MIIKLNIPAIKKLMATESLTNAELSARSGISRQNVSTILRRGTCSAINAGRLAVAFGVDVTEIWKED